MAIAIYNSQFYSKYCESQLTVIDFKQMKPIFSHNKTKRVPAGRYNVQKVTSKVKPTQRKVYFLKLKQNCIIYSFTFCRLWNPTRMSTIISFNPHHYKRKGLLGLQMPTIKTKWDKTLPESMSLFKSSTHHPTRDLKAVFDVCCL